MHVFATRVVLALIARLAGRVILAVIEGEVPSERQCRLRAFAVGAAGYTTCLLAACGRA